MSDEKRRSAEDFASLFRAIEESQCEYEQALYASTITYLTAVRPQDATAAQSALPLALTNVQFF